MNLPPSVWEGKTIPVDNASLCCILVKADAAQRAGFVKKELFISADDYFLSRELNALGEIIQVGTVVVTHPIGAQVRFTMRRGQRRVPAEDYWRTYYRVRNALLFEKRYYNAREAVVRFTIEYFRSLAAILLIDDHKFYRVGILTRALVDGLLGRTGKRVDPRAFSCHSNTLCHSDFERGEGEESRSAGLSRGGGNQSEIPRSARNGTRP